MLDNELIELFLPIVQNGLIAQGYTNVAVVSSAQPVQQGINSTPTAFFQKLSTKRYGFPRAEYVWDSLNNVENYVMKYFLETEFKFMALSRADPSDIAAPTASDILDAIATTLQTDTTVFYLKSQGVGILRITQESAPYFSDDMDRFEQAPYLSFVLTHVNYVQSAVPAASTVTPGIYRV